MLGILILILAFVSLALMVVILLQSGKGGGLAAGFGGAGTGIEMMGSRQTATFLHSATKWLGGAFLVIAFAISLITVRGTGPRSVIEQNAASQPTAPATQAGAPADLQEVLGGGDAATEGSAPATDVEPGGAAAE